MNNKSAEFGTNKFTGKLIAQRIRQNAILSGERFRWYSESMSKSQVSERNRIVKNEPMAAASKTGLIQCAHSCFR